ncbi:hypothetical protein XELAEV_18022432mg [Xenopus laevis]|uniref:Helix-turn-helix domain-containing protein n=1 Tax=Xenopus laevis TaxID=8355 RepID=A0A974D3C1_XENLA|nr:hypothetical protein XELAEV_18022432mg [Xenopus laevis]
MILNSLDVQLIRCGSKITTDIFRKNIDSNSVLHCSSFHPQPLKKSLLFTQFTSVKRIVSEGETCTTQLTEMAEHFTKRGYLKDMIEQGLQTVWNTNRFMGRLMGSKNKKTWNGVRLVFVSSFFHHPHTVKEFEIKHFFMCRSSLDLYLLKCPYGLIYIGETTQQMKDHFYKHKSTIYRNLTTLPVPAHFHQVKHSISQLKFQIIDTVEIPRRGGDRLLQLKHSEMFWIHKLDTLWPRGLNRDYPPSLFIQI